MGSIPWILISVAGILVVLGVVALLALKKGKRRPIDYYSFFIIGIIWTAAGIPLGNYALSVMGIIFMIIGLANKNKWKKNRVHWNDLTKEEKKWRMILIVLLGVLVLAGFVAWFLVANGII